MAATQPSPARAEHPPRGPPTLGSLEGFGKPQLPPASLQGRGGQGLAWLSSSPRREQKAQLRVSHPCPPPSSQATLQPCRADGLPGWSGSPSPLSCEDAKDEGSPPVLCRHHSHSPQEVEDHTTLRVRAEQLRLQEGGPPLLQGLLASQVPLEGGGKCLVGRERQAPAPSIAWKHCRYGNSTGLHTSARLDGPPTLIPTHPSRGATPPPRCAARASARNLHTCEGFFKLGGSPLSPHPNIFTSCH